MGSGRKNKKYDSQAKITSEPSRKNPWDIENSHPKKITNNTGLKNTHHSKKYKSITSGGSNFLGGFNKKYKLYQKNLKKNLIYDIKKNTHTHTNT